MLNDTDTKTWQELPSASFSFPEQSHQYHSSPLVRWLSGDFFEWYRAPTPDTYHDLSKLLNL